MPYMRPPLFVRRVFNPLAMRFRIGGSQALSVTRRRTHGLQRVPVIPVDVDGQRYLVSPRGETDWVRNLRATPHCTLGPHGHEVPYRASEVAVGERPPVLTAYRAVAGRAVKPFFEALPDAKDHPVFRVDAE